MAYVKRYSTSSENRLSDRDMLQDLLATEKYLSHFYDHAIMESSDDTIRDMFEGFQHDEHENARTLYNVMEKRNWYTVGQKPSKSSVNRNKESKRLSTSRPNRHDASVHPTIKAESTYAIRRPTNKRFGSHLRNSTSVI